MERDPGSVAVVQVPETLHHPHEILVGLEASAHPVVIVLKLLRTSECRNSGKRGMEKISPDSSFFNDSRSKNGASSAQNQFQERGNHVIWWRKENVFFGGGKAAKSKGSKGKPVFPGFPGNSMAGQITPRIRSPSFYHIIQPFFGPFGAKMGQKSQLSKYLNEAKWKKMFKTTNESLRTPYLSAPWFPQFPIWPEIWPFFCQWQKYVAK